MAPETTDLLRVYDPSVDPFDGEGYPLAWREVKHLIREQAGHRCVRCGHPYRNGEHGNGEWSPCDERCTHGGPLRAACTPLSVPTAGQGVEIVRWLAERGSIPEGSVVEAQWRILTVHHLNGDKADLRWWNICALDQRCHLSIQGKVRLDRPWDREHSAWFRPYAAGYYAWRYLGEDLPREEVEARMDELLDLELRQVRLEGFPA